MRRVLTLLTLIAVTGCGTATGTAWHPSATTPLHLLVSNQSFIDKAVRLRITVDGTLIADHAFPADGLHTAIPFQIDLPARQHVLTATSSTGVTMTVHLDTEGVKPKYGALFLWHYGDKHGRHFSWDVQDTPIMLS